MRRARGASACGFGAVTEVPLDGDALALGIADDALAVATELRIVAGQQHESGQHTGTELLQHGALAVVAVHLPVR